MSGRKILMLTCALAGCAANTAPRGYLATSSTAQSTAYGGWIDLRMMDGNRPVRVLGELIAVSQDSVWVLDGDGGTALATGLVRSGTLTGWDTEAGHVALTTLGGTVSTISNGAFLLFTAPGWLIVGGVAASRQSRLADQDVASRSWTDLAAFARFPQGMPEGLRLSELTPKNPG